MDSFRYLRVIGILSTIFSEVHPASVSFCDGSELVQKTREQCGAGVTFGDNKPECVCVSGIYRFITDSCETADGFAESVCTKLTNSNGGGASIVGVKFTRDPINWAQTGIICERRGFGTETWDFITERHARGSPTKSSNIYVLNGQAFMTKGHHDKQVICVQPSKLPENKNVCRYLKSENAKLWTETEIEVIVKNSCEGGKELSSHKCFGVLSNKDSECQLRCSSSTPPPRHGRQSAPGASGRSISDANAKKPAAAAKKSEPQAKSASPTMPEPISAMNATHPTEYWKHDNKFLNRKMMIYNIINQIGPADANQSNSTNSSPFGEPKRTFELFDTMKSIATSYCPDEYVNTDWIELVIDLFYILHKGNLLKYDENLSEDDYTWIKNILSKCQARIVEQPEGENVVKLSPTPTHKNPAGAAAGEEICRSGGRVAGYCNGTSPTGECNFKPVTVKKGRANDSMHYVPDVAWDIVDIIQVICFKEFNESYRMFHVLEQAAEKLFTLQIKNLWYFPNWTSKIKKRLLGTSADIQMWNLEVCVESAYDRNGQIPRLVRPVPIKYLRKKRSTASKRQGCNTGGEPPPIGPA